MAQLRQDNNAGGRTIVLGGTAARKARDKTPLLTSADDILLPNVILTQSGSPNLVTQLIPIV